MLTSRLFGGMPVTSEPCSQMVPVVGSSNPAIIRMVVVLPQPDGPSREKNSPSAMVRSSPATAVTTPPRAWNSLTTPVSSMAGSEPACRVAAGAAAWLRAAPTLPCSSCGPAGPWPAAGSAPARAGVWLSVIGGGYPLLSARPAAPASRVEIVPTLSDPDLRRRDILEQPNPSHYLYVTTDSVNTA